MIFLSTLCHRDELAVAARAAPDCKAYGYTQFIICHIRCLCNHTFKCIHSNAYTRGTVATEYIVCSAKAKSPLTTHDWFPHPSRSNYTLASAVHYFVSGTTRRCCTPQRVVGSSRNSAVCKPTTHNSSMLTAHRIQTTERVAS